MKPILKNKHKKFKIALCTGLILTFVGGPVVEAGLTYFQGPSYMPQAEVYRFCEEVGADTSYIGWNDYNSKQPKIMRASFPNSKPLQFNIHIDLNEEQKNTFNTVINDINYIFEVVRPENKVSVEFNPNFFDKINKYYVDVYEMDEHEDPEVGGYWNPTYSGKNKNGVTHYHSSIKIKQQFLNDYQAICHEFMHHVAELGDAYLIYDKLTVPTVMLAITNKFDDHIHRNDVALICAKYGDYSTPEKKQKLIDFINNYESSQQWYKDLTLECEEMTNYLLNVEGVNLEDVNFNFDDMFMVNSRTYMSLSKNINYNLFDNNVLIYDNNSLDFYIKDYNLYVQNKNLHTKQFTCLIGDKRISYDIFSDQISMYASIGDQAFQITKKVGDKPYYKTIGTIVDKSYKANYDNLKLKWENYSNNNSYEKALNLFFDDISILDGNYNIYNAKNMTLYDEENKDYIKFDDKYSYCDNYLSHYAYLKSGILIKTSFAYLFLKPTSNSEVELYKIKNNNQQLYFDKHGTYKIQLNENQAYSDFIQSKNLEYNL